MPYPSQELTASSKAPNQELKDLGVLCTLKLKIESNNVKHGCIIEQSLYPYQEQDAIPQSGTSSILQSHKSGLIGHGCSLHLQNQDRQPKFRSWMYQKPLTISKARLRFQTLVRNLQRPQKLQIRT